MTNLKPVFPKAVLAWTDRVDQTSTVFANDPNSLASDLISVENTLGVMPQVEKNGFSAAQGNVTYATVDARISDVNAGNLHPYAELQFSTKNVSSGATFQANTGKAPGVINEYVAGYDPFKFYNGNDATIAVGAGGLYLIVAWQQWPFSTNGFVAQHLFVNGQWQNTNLWNWDFPATGPSAWDRTGFNARRAMTNITWMGYINQNWRVQIVSENGTSKSVVATTSGNLHIYALRKLPVGVD